MAKTKRPPITLLASKLWGEKIAKLLEACNFSALDVEHATGIHNDKVGRWCNREVGKGRPLARADEAWVLAKYFAAKLIVEPGAILEYLVNDDQPIGTPADAMQAAWNTKFTPAPPPPPPEPAPPTVPFEHVRGRRGEARPRRKSSRADAKRKHLSG